MMHLINSFVLVAKVYHIAGAVLMATKNNRLEGEQSLLLCCLFVVIIISKPLFSYQAHFSWIALNVEVYYKLFISASFWEPFLEHNVQSKG